MKLGYGELALEGNRRDMAEINLWALIVVKLSELGILKRYIIIIIIIKFKLKYTGIIPYG